MAEPVKIFCRNCHAKLDVSDFEPYEQFPCPSCGTLLRVPKRFDRYLLERLCGRGGMSKVHRAIEPELARRVAVKILDEPAQNGEIYPLFVNAARISGKLNHRAVVPVYNCGICEGHSFLAMRFMENGDLERMMKEKRLPALPVLIAYLTVIAEGLLEGAKLHIVHHDVKPSNIMLTAENEPKLGDFDLADIREPGDIETPCAENWCSPIYASPERLYYGGEDSRGDIFCLGVSIYELVTGIAPFGLTGEAQEFYDRRQLMSFDPLVSLRPEAGPRLSNLVQAMLDFTPENRPSYTEILSVMHEVLAELAGSAEEESCLALHKLLPDWFNA